MREIDEIKHKIDILLVEQEEQINGAFDNLIEAYIKEAYNLGLQDAADNAKTKEEIANPKAGSFSELPPAKSEEMQVIYNSL
jgi:hypothetical protein